ncbi:MAG: CTP synthase [Candidatus Aenigmatarchaeota archaeon]
MRLIFVTGGIISGVGKGIATASIGKILQSKGFSCTAVKIDPYINCDAGTMRPTEHGEVWVTDDGGEIDQDLGNYERFLGVQLSKRNNITTGQVYKEIIEKERRGEYLGKTVQFIPHVPEEIKKRIKEVGSGYDFVLVEIGGTVGDYENLPFLFAAHDLERELGKENVIHILVTYMPVPSHIHEMKTKPTQQAIRMLNENGIFPDFVLCRGPHALDDVRRGKIETYSGIDKEHIISAPDVKTIYEVPLNFENEGLGSKILKRFGISLKPSNLIEWEKLTQRILNPGRKIKIAMVGKYFDIGDYTLADSYISVIQSLEHAGANLDVGVDIDWIDAKKLENVDARTILNEYDGVVVPGGFGTSGVEGKINAIRFARETNVPYLGLCYGMQLAVVEYARNVCELNDANTTEVDPNTKNPVITLLESQKQLLANGQYGATMRLGAYAACMKQSRVLNLYKESGRFEKDMKRIAELARNPANAFRIGHCKGEMVLERHRHRYEVNPDYIKVLEESGLVFSGMHVTTNETNLMEFMELAKHKFFVATQAHPEFKSSLTDVAPLFLGFVRACAA